MADIGYVLLVDGGTIACDAIYNNSSSTAASTIMAANLGSVLHITTAFTANTVFYGLATVIDVSQTKRLYGGSGSGSRTSTNLTLANGTYTDYICGGGSGGNVTGTAKLTIESGVVLSSTSASVYGAGNNATTTTANTDVTIRGKVEGYFICGGGNSGAVTGSTSLKLEGATVDKVVFGGGNTTTATVGTEGALTGSTYIKFSDDAFVKQYVCGGGRGDVYGNTHVVLADATINQSIYGGGVGTANVTGTATVEITDGLVKENVYGGATAGGTVGNTSITVSGGEITGNVYGGSKANSDVTGLATISIEGGEFSATSRVFGGGELTTAGTYHQASNVTLDDADVTLQRLAGGAQASAAGNFTLTGDTKVTLAQGTVSQAVVGRVNAYKGAAVTDGGANTVSTVDITGGQAHIVAGAGLVSAASTTYTYTGDTVINVSGGTFDYLFGGNVGSQKAFCTNTTMTGDVAITVNTSGNNKVTLKYLYAGSNSSSGSEAKQNGSTLVTFSGLGSNLIWTEGGISGDGSGKLGDIDKTQGYSRTLLFDGFTGVFSAPVISRFDTIAFEDSTVTFGASKLVLNGVAEWDFKLGSSLTWNNGINSFDDDDLVFGKAGDTISTAWEVITSNKNTVFAGWESAHITLFGTVLTTYDDDTLTWSKSGFGYVAKWDDEDHKIIIAQA